MDLERVERVAWFVKKHPNGRIKESKNQKDNTETTRNKHESKGWVTKNPTQNNETKQEPSTKPPTTKTTRCNEWQ